MTLKLTTSLVAISAALATPALADVTAADVWSNQQALYAAFGGTLSGEMTPEGAVSPEVNFILPEGAGSLQIKMDPITLDENNDGSVTITWPSPMTILVAGGISGEGTFTAELTAKNDSYTSTATGDAGDIEYDTEATNWQVEVVNVTVDDAQGEAVSITGGMTLDTFTNVSRVTEGNLITYTAQSETGTSNAEFTFNVDNVTSTSTQTSQPITAAVAATLPVGGSDLMNLSQAMRDGLNIAIESTGAGSASSTVTTLNGDILNSQETTTGAQTASIVLGEDGLSLTADADGFSMAFNDPLLFPAPLEFAIDAITAAYNLPLNASDAAQDFRIATSLQGITMGETIWNMFDPASQLPRDPAEVTFDITGMGTSGLDLLDFAAMGQIFGPPPVQIDEVTIENLNIAAVGAQATAEGSMTLDWTDLETFAGFPRPEGAVTINLNGANALMDTLVEMGFIPAEDLMMPRMMMGMFATQVGNDQLETVIEVNEEGHLLANGQRLQ